MYNKKALTDIVKNLGSAKAPTKKPDIIYDPMGQWTNPGQNTRVPTSDGKITMGSNPETGQPIPFPVFAQPNVGPGVMMQPGQDYTFPGANYVDEFPQVKKGGLVKQPKKYSRSLMAKNILFVKNSLLKKKKSVKNKIFDPNSPYFQDGGTFEIELDDAEIDQYRKGGYIVEELDTYDGGGEVTINNVTYVKYGDNWVNKNTGVQVKDEGLIYKLYNTKPTEVTTGNPIKPIPLGSKPIVQKIKELSKSPLIANQEEAKRLIKDKEEENQKLYEIKRQQDLYNPQLGPDELGGLTYENNKYENNGIGNTIEFDINRSLGFPMDKAVLAADAANQYNEDQPDNFRHPNAARYTAEAIANSTGNIPYVSNAYGFIGANALGIGHELSTLMFNPNKDNRSLYNKLKEYQEDIYNNYVGSKVGASDMTPKEKTDYLLYLSNTNQLPDGVVIEKPEKGFSNNMYFKKNKNDKGQYKGSYAKGGEPCPQGFQEDPVTGECVALPERTQDIQEVRTNQYTPYVTAYEQANPRDAYVYQKKADYLKKNKGLNKRYGLSQENFPENVENKFNKNWEYNRNSAVINQYAKDNEINPKNHVDIVEKMADKGNVSYDMIANSKYGSKLQPSLWAKSLAGAQELGNFIVKQSGKQGDVFNIQTPGLTKTEWEDIHNSSIGALETASVLDIPGAVIGNAVADLSISSGGNYQESPGILSGELKSNMTPLKATVLNPINYLGFAKSLSASPKMSKILFTNLINPLNYEAKEKSLPGSPNAAIVGSSQIPQNKYGGLNKFIEGGEPCPQGFQEDPVTGDCVSIMGQTERVQSIEEVPTNQYSKYIAAYEEAHPRDAFVYKKKADYLKRYKNWNRQAGLSQDNFNTDVEGNFNRNWEYDRNTAVIEQYAKDHGINPKNHVEIVEKMADKGAASYDMIAHSKYGSKLQPTMWARTLAGGQELGNFLVKSSGLPALLATGGKDVFNKEIKGLTKKENKEIHEGNFGALESLAWMDHPGLIIGNALSNASLASGGGYGDKDKPGFFSGEFTSNMDPLKAALLNPANYADLGLGMVSPARAGIRAASTLSKFDDIAKGAKNLVKATANYGNDEVKLVANARRSQELDGEAFSIYKGNKNVGEISGTRSSNGDFIVSDVGVDTPFQKQGIGTQAYKQLNESLSPGNKVKSWGAFVEDAGVAPGRNTWQNLERKGLAKLNEKGIYEMLPVGNNQYGGLHRFTDGGPIKGSQGLNADFSTNLTAFINAAKAEGIDLNIGSGFRTAEKQKQLWEQALKKYGSPEKARKWVAPPGKSNHNRGTAVDLHSNGNALGKQKNSKATQWAHANAEKYGLNFRMGHEPWHIEPLKLSKEQKIKIDSEHQHSDSEDPDTHVDPNNIETLSKEGIDMDKYYQNLVEEQETTDVDNDYSNWNPREEVVVDPRIAQLNAYSKLMTPSIQNVNDMLMATKINQQQQQKQFAKGGYIEVEANDNDINNYIKDGYFVEEVSSSSLPKNKNGGLHMFAVGGGGPCPEGQEWDEASQSCIDVLPEPVITSVPMVNTVPVEQPVQPETTVKLNDNTVVRAPIVNNIEINEEKINVPSKNNNVIDIQRKLKAAGYDIGKSGPNGDGVDGVMGNKTRIAEEAYRAGIPATKIKVADPKKPVIGQTKDYIVNKNLKDGYLPYLDSGEEACVKGKKCSANVSIKMASLLGNVTDKSLWANDAWFNKSEILNKGGDLIYENKERDYTKMQKVPRDVWNKLQVGDYVQLNRKDTPTSADFAAETKPGLKNEGIEHLGFIVGKDKDGTPLVWHGSETGKAFIKRIDEPISLDDHNKNTFTYQVASIVRSPVLKNADFSGLQESAYYTKLDPNKKLVSKKGATELQSQATNTINKSVGQFKNVGYKQDDVNYVSQILIGGIMSNETEAGESKSRVVKEIAATIWKNYLGQGTSEASVGYYQLKPHLNFTNKDGSLNTIGKKLEKLGVSVDDIGNDIDSQTKAGTLLLLDIYSQLKKDKDFNPKTGLYKNKIPASYILAKSWQAGPGWYKEKKYKKYLDNFDIDYSNNALKNLGTVDVVGQNKSARNEYIKHVRPEVLKYQAQLKIYTFPGSKSLYKKDVNGNWYINKNSKSGKFVKIIDPKGTRIKNLNKFAKLKVKSEAKSKGAWYDPRSYFKEGGSVVEEGIVVEADDNDIKNYLGNGYIVEEID